MIYHLLTTLLAPLFMVQGIYVRRVTPKLPEPIGARSGIAGSGPRMSMLIVGDSAAAGVGVKTQDEALTGRLVKTLSSTHEVSWKLLALTGDNSAEVLARLKSEPKESYESVVVSVGVNDVTGRTGTEAWAINLQNIIDILKNKYEAQYIFMSSIPPMHIFPALPQPLRWWLGQRAKKLNAIMKKVTEINEKCFLVCVSFPIDNQFIAADGFHPGAEAYKLWGNHVAELIQVETEVKSN
ncbi:MAG: lysophospholipase L1-like esterase [Polaribacter sp.]|jgi:lysophospholipase L1-like esterase